MLEMLILFQLFLCRLQIRRFDDLNWELVCIPCRLAYTVRDDIPIMLINEARELSADEADALRS